MRSEDGSERSSNQSANDPRLLSLSDSPLPPAGLSAWQEIPPEVSIPGESFHDTGRMIFSLPLTHSRNLDPKLILKKAFVVRNLALRQGDIHLPLKRKIFYLGNPVREQLTSSGLAKFRASRLVEISKWRLLAFGRLTWKGLAQRGQATIDTLKRLLGER